VAALPCPSCRAPVIAVSQTPSNEWRRRSSSTGPRPEPRRRISRLGSAGGRPTCYGGGSDCYKTSWQPSSECSTVSLVWTKEACCE
jgi:hypothetical protein